MGKYQQKDMSENLNTPPSFIHTAKFNCIEQTRRNKFMQYTCPTFPIMNSDFVAYHLEI